MKDGSKIDDLSPCQDVGPGGPIEDSQSEAPRPRQKRKNRTGISRKGLGSAGQPLSVSSDATPASLSEGAGENDTRQLPIVAPDYSGPKLNMLLIEQLSFSVPQAHPDTNLGVQREIGAIELYQDFKPIDATESALARIAVGLTNATMEGLQRAASNSNLDARQSELRLSQKSAATLIDVLTLLEKHRGLGPQVSVGSVNVGSGGQAIVGNVQSPSKPEDKRLMLDPSKSRGNRMTFRRVSNVKTPRT
jgi:hypothetical protein